MTAGHKIRDVKGINPTTGDESVSSLYSRITEANVGEVFQTDLSHKCGEGVMGAKAVMYVTDSGEYSVAFLTEAVNTHHRHALATLVGMDDPRARALYNGDCSKSQDLLDRCAGFEMQYDSTTGRIIGIQQDSWLTKRQIELGRVLRQDIQEDMVLTLLDRIEPAYLSQPYADADVAEDERLFIYRAA